MVSAESFHRDDPTGTENPGCSVNAVFTSSHGFTVIREPLWAKIVTGATSRTSHGLRMKPPVSRVAIFPSTEIVQRTLAHSCVRPVVRQALHHGISRTAIGAVDVGIQVARIGWVEEFSQTLITNWQVWRNSNRRALPPLAFP